MSQPMVGIIANPASGRDIRRLVAHGTVFDNNEKTAIVRRVLIGLEAVGISSVAYMPDLDFGILQRALADLHIKLETTPLPMPIFGTAADSTRAAQLLAEQGAGCIVTLGGDGTNRAVAKGSGTVPLVPISTGTNNAFPTFLEGTVAGMAAGLVAIHENIRASAQRVPWLEVSLDGEPRDHALIDVVLSTLPFVGSRAIWDLSVVRDVVLSRISAGTIGLSALGGALLDHHIAPGSGMHITLGQGPTRVLAALAPGLVKHVEVASFQRLAPDDGVQFQPGVGTVALDGEREIELSAHSLVEVHLRSNGPVVVDVPAALGAATLSGYLRS